MLIPDLLHETYSAITANKSRSGLTILGIVIGIGSVISMVSIGQGAQGSVASKIQSIGSNLIIVTPGAQHSGFTSISAGRGSAQTLKQSDASAIESQISNIQAISPEINRRFQVTYKDQNTNTSVTGVTDAYQGVHNIALSEGTFISSQNITNYSKVAVIGPTTASDLFPDGSDPVGQTIRVGSVDFQIIGITVAKGGTGFNNQDDIILIPLSTDQRFLVGNSANYLSSIYIQATDSNSMASVQSQVSDLLLGLHKISNPTQADFTVLNESDVVATASSVADTFTILLAAIAGISLLVGGIGIMNMMLTIVTERTREIGLRKAIGAKRRDITLQFLAESVALTFIGGLIGVILGWIISLIVSKFFSMPTIISASSVILAFGVSAAIGIVFGYYPARRAARLNPIEALRYE